MLWVTCPGRAPEAVISVSCAGTAEAKPKNSEGLWLVSRTSALSFCSSQALKLGHLGAGTFSIIKV